MTDLYKKYGIPREINGVKIKLVVLGPDQDVKFGRVIRQDPDVNCAHPRCFRVRPVHSRYCAPHEPVS